MGKARIILTEKNDAQIPAVRMPKIYRKMLEHKAKLKNRKLSDFCRIKLIEIAKEEEKEVG